MCAKIERPEHPREGLLRDRGEGYTATGVARSARRWVWNIHEKAPGWLTGPSLYGRITITVACYRPKKVAGPGATDLGRGNYSRLVVLHPSCIDLTNPIIALRRLVTRPGTQALATYLNTSIIIACFVYIWLTWVFFSSCISHQPIRYTLISFVEEMMIQKCMPDNKKHAY